MIIKQTTAYLHGELILETAQVMTCIDNGCCTV